MQRRRVIARAVGIGAWCLAGMAVLAAGGGPQGRQGGPPSAANVTPPTGTAAISGVVTDAVTTKPLAGVVVTVSGTPSTPGTGMVGSSLPRARQLTDESGRFVMTDLPGDFTYSISATKFGYFDGAYGRGGLGASAPGRRIALVEGQWFRDGKVELTPHGSISGTIVDESGEPVVDVTVRAYAEIFVSGSRHVASGVEATTDDRGRYRLPAMSPGRYLIAVPSTQHAVPLDVSIATELLPPGQTTAVAESEIVRGLAVLAPAAGNRLVLNPNAPTVPPVAGGRPQVYPTIFHPGVRTLREATAIDLKPGEERVAVDLQISPVPVVTISGILQGPPEAIKGMPLRLMAQGSEGLGRGSESATTTAAADGSFTFLNVASGSYTIVAGRSIGEYNFRAPFAGGGRTPIFPGTRMTTSSSSSVQSGPQGLALSRYMIEGDPRFYGRRTVTVAGSAVSGVIIPLQTGVTISGQVVFEGKTRPTGSPFGMWMTAEPANGDPTLSQFRSGRGAGPPVPRPPTPPDGPPPPPEDFLIEGVQAGEFLLRTLGGVVKSIMWNGRDYADMPFDTTTGRDITGVVVTLTDQSGAVFGVVRDGSGQPAANAAVITFPTDRSRWTGYGPQPTRLRATIPSSDGRYSMSAMQAGDYFVVAVDDELAERWKDPTFLETLSRVATRVRLEWGERRTLDLMRQEVK
jgi:hypothetical protein